VRPRAASGRHDSATKVTGVFPAVLLIVLLSPFPQGKNVVHQLSVTLEDLYNGVTKKLALQKNVICEKCEGKNECLNESHSCDPLDLETVLIVL